MAITHSLIHVFARIHPALFPVFRDEFNLSLQQLGLIAAMPNLSSTILSIPSGFLADKLGSRTILTISFLIAGIAAIGISQSINPIMLTLAITAVILTSTLYHPASFSHISKMYPEKGRSKALGVHNAGGTLGMSLGPLSLTLLVGTIGWEWRSLYLFWALPVLAVIIAIWKIQPVVHSASRETHASIPLRNNELKRTPESTIKSLLSAPLLIFLVFAALRMLSMEILSTFIPTYLHDIKGLSVSQAGLIYGTVSLMGAVAGPLGGYFADRFGNKRWLMIVIAASATSLLVASFMPSVLLFICFYFLYSFFGGCGMAANTGMVAMLTPRSQRGMGFALFFLPGSLIGGFAPLAGATIAEALGLSYLFPIAVVIAIASLIVLKFGVNV